MGATVANSVQAPPIKSSDFLVGGAKGVAKPVKNVDRGQLYRVLLGAALKRARIRCDWSLKEFSAEMNRDDSLVSRWESGEKMPPWDELFAHNTLRPQLILALAEIDGDNIEIRTTVTIKGAAR